MLIKAMFSVLLSATEAKPQDVIRGNCHNFNTREEG